jgi:DNA-directed RNA polymerase specialized sigma24 family protein
MARHQTKNTHPFTVDLPLPLVNKLRAVSKKTGRKMKWIVERALVQWFESRKERLKAKAAARGAADAQFTGAPHSDPTARPTAASTDTVSGKTHEAVPPPARTSSTTPGSDDLPGILRASVKPEDLPSFLARLPTEEHRAIVTLALMGKSLKEIAATFKRSPATINKRLRESLELLPKEQRS